MSNTQHQILVTGAHGKTGSRICQRLAAANIPFRKGSRSGQPAFDWNDRATWADALAGMHSAYMCYLPDLAVPASVSDITAFCDTAKAAGLQKLVLLSGRGEPEAQACEVIVQQSGLQWTVIRASWFNQNFSEGYLLESVLSGHVVLPAGKVGEPFADADDIADVAFAALTDERHNGKVYEVTGPRLLSFAAAVAEIAAAHNREINYLEVPLEAYVARMKADGVPEDYIWLIRYLFAEVLDGRNESIAYGVQEALGRPAKDFAAFAADAAAAGCCNPQNTEAV